MKNQSFIMTLYRNLTIKQKDGLFFGPVVLYSDFILKEFISAQLPSLSAVHVFVASQRSLPSHKHHDVTIYIR